MAAAFAAAPILTGVLLASTVVAVGTGAFAAIQQARAAREQAEAEEVRERQFALQGAQESNLILEQEIDTLAAINVAAGASGIDPFTGSPAETKTRIRERANRQLNISRLSTATNVTASQSAQRQASLSGQAALIRGAGQAAGSLIGTSTRLQGIGG